MSGPHFSALVVAEVRKLFSRTSARAGIVIGVLIGIGVPLVRGLWRVAELRLAAAIAADIGAELPPLPAIEPDSWVFYALGVRNFFVLRILIIMMAALIFAAEYQSRTVREDLLRPVPRWSVLLAKWLALLAWIAVTLVATLVPASLVSIVAWGTDGDWGRLLLGYLATFAADAAFAALALAISIATRSVAGTIVGMVLFYMLDFALWVGLLAIQYLPLVDLPEWAKTAVDKAFPWLPSSAFGVWTGASSTAPWSWEGFASLGIIGVASLVLGGWVLSRMDVP
jgi:ABC-type transport system involved in multi-copper enzyme maturation permease subunit